MWRTRIITFTVTTKESIIIVTAEISCQDGMAKIDRNSLENQNYNESIRDINWHFHDDNGAALNSSTT